MVALILIVLLLIWVFKGIDLSSYKHDSSWDPQDGPTRWHGDGENDR